VSTGSTVKLCRFGLCEFLENNGCYSFRKNPYFLFSVEQKLGQRVGQAKNGGGHPRPSLALHLAEVNVDLCYITLLALKPIKTTVEVILNVEQTATSKTKNGMKYCSLLTKPTNTIMYRYVASFGTIISAYTSFLSTATSYQMF